MTLDPKKRLGRGLDGLLPAARTTGPVTASTAPIEDVHPNRAQPRTRFDDQKLEELAASIRSMGVLEPILVRRRPSGGFEIVAGERRWRAAQRAGLRDVPIHVRELSGEAAFEAAIVENLQREDLNAVEIARAFQRLCDEHGHSHETIAQKIGKDRSTVANSVRLLQLPEPVLHRIENGELSEGHGRAILQAKSATTMQKLAAEAVARGWSVRETERQARAASPSGKQPAPPVGKSANVRDLENRLSKKLGARVVVHDDGGKGSLELRYTSLDELDRLISTLMK
jgi:ParB family transcriptional regulator, chromosome partitioning protein